MQPHTICKRCVVAKQWTSLLLKKVYSSVVKNVPPPQVWGRKWQARRGVNKREVVTAYLFPPGTRSVAQIDPRAFQNSPSSQKRKLTVYSLPSVFTGTKGVRPEIASPRNSFYQLRLGRTDNGARCSERGRNLFCPWGLWRRHKWQGLPPFSGLLILALFFSYRPAL